MRGFEKVSFNRRMWKLSPSLRDASASMAHSKSLGPWRTAEPRVDAEPTLYFGLAVVVRSSTVGMAPMRGAAGARGLNAGASAPVGARAAPQPRMEKIIIETIFGFEGRGVTRGSSQAAVGCLEALASYQCVLHSTSVAWARFLVSQLTAALACCKTLAIVF